MEIWIKKNLRYITIAFIVLFLFKSMQGCSRKMANTKQKKYYTEKIDSLNKINMKIVDSLNNEILVRTFLIKDLSSELKISGIKYDEAQKRADAVQKTVSSIRTNTTIEIKGINKN